MSVQVYIGLGGNIKQPKENVKSALIALSKLPNTTLVNQSKLYASRPMGEVEQPDYINAVALLSTELSPQALFTETCRIEQQHHRVRNGVHWGPRTLDLDLLLYGEQVISDSNLQIPHYGLKNREFVVYPLLDINPELVLPCGTSVQSLTEHLPFNDMTIVE